jgi:hypothetical protein
MDPLLLKPEDFMHKWAELFGELLMEGELYEKAVGKKNEGAEGLRRAPAAQRLAFCFGTHLQAHEAKTEAHVANRSQALPRANCTHPYVRSVSTPLLQCAAWRTAIF